MFIKKITPKVMGVSNAIAAGLMMGASFGLLFEASEYDEFKMIKGFLAGVIFILIFDWLLDVIRKKRLHLEDDDLAAELTHLGGDWKKSALIIIIMTFHSVAEGIGIGASFGGTVKFGILMSIAIAIHNIPEGLAISAVMVSQGASWKKAAFWSVFSSLPQPLMAVPAFLFVNTFKPYMPAGLGLAAGAMIWLIFAEVAPEATENIGTRAAATLITLSIVAMLAIQYFL
ncbi:MAG: ZIP family metal transporter [Chlorobi bacterium]|nr:ZIP family metal transporter [Chlorobiota bacterium]